MTITLEMQLRVEDLFGQLGREEEPLLDKDIQVVRNTALELITQGFEDVVKNLEYPRYDEIFKYIPENYSARDIESFSFILNKYQEMRLFLCNSGHYLSALINKCEDNEFTIHTRHLEKFPESIGLFNNGKKIIVLGNVGNYLGLEMKEGNIVVNGDTGDWIGAEMSGGELHVEGSIGSLVSTIRSGNIYHKGKQIVKDGELVA